MLTPYAYRLLYPCIFTLLLFLFPTCSGEQIDATTTTFNNGNGAEDGNDTSGILDEDDTDTLTQRSEGIMGYSTTESQSDPYHMMLGIGASVPIGCLESEDGLHEIDSSLSF